MRPTDARLALSFHSQLNPLNFVSGVVQVRLQRVEDVMVTKGWGEQPENLIGQYREVVESVERRNIVMCDVIATVTAV